MKPGRPKCHIKGKWITWKEQNIISYYELDSKEELIRQGGLIQVHHTKTNDDLQMNQKDNAQIDSNQLVLKPNVSEIDNFIKDSASINAKPAASSIKEDESQFLLDSSFDFTSIMNSGNEDFPFFADFNQDQEESWFND